jgi:hypothetical protein
MVGSLKGNLEEEGRYGKGRREIKERFKSVL